MKLKQLFFLFIIFVNSFLTAQNNYINHKIEKGETLTQICEKYDVSKTEVLKLNPDVASGLKEGAYLIVPKLASNNVEKSKTQKQSKVNHIVEAKETLFGLSKKYNLSVDELVKANPELKDGLKVGQILIIPDSTELLTNNQEENKSLNTGTKEKSPEYHIVKSGDTKFSLAKKYGITIQELENLNPEIKNGFPIDFKLKLKKDTNLNNQINNKTIDSNKKEEIKKEKFDIGKNQIVAQKGMTLYSIATDNNISVEELIIANPSLKEGLKENDIVNIPNSSIQKPKQNPAQNTTTSSKRIAILVPFNGIDKNKINSQLSSDKFLNMVADFYLGTKIAIDSAKSKKMKHYIEYFDSNETSNASKIEELINTGKLNNFDVIIGCFYPANNDKLVQLLTDKPVVVISPLRFQDTSYATLVETMVKKEELYDEMINYFSKERNNLISIIDSKKVSSVNYFDAQSSVNRYKFEDKDYFKTEELMTTLQKDKNNIIFFDSESLKFLNKLNQLVSELKADGYQVQLVALEYHMALEADEVFDDFVKNELIYFSTYDNRDTNKTKLFDKNFRSKYKGMPNQFVYRGYDIAMDVFERASQPNTFINSLSNDSTQISTNFNYVKTSNEGFKNKGFYLIKMNKNKTINLFE